MLPAIDLRGGRVVRLRQGSFEDETRFSDDPVAVARGFVEGGAAMLHVVDLDGARVGAPMQLHVLAGITAAIGCPVQYGGGLRSRAHVDDALASGASRVVMGSALLEDEALRRELARGLQERLVAALDARDGRVRVRGWAGDSGVAVAEAAARCAADGIRRALVTDISRDGMLAGPNLELCDEVRRSGIANVIVSGGVASAADVARCRAAGFAGVVLGMALHSGVLAVADALSAGSPGPASTRG